MERPRAHLEEKVNYYLLPRKLNHKRETLQPRGEHVECVGSNQGEVNEAQKLALIGGKKGGPMISHRSPKGPLVGGKESTARERWYCGGVRAYKPEEGAFLLPLKGDL